MSRLNGVSQRSQRLSSTMKLYRAAGTVRANTAAEFRGPSYLLVSISVYSLKSSVAVVLQ
jgi:hypothetical protein